MTKAVIVGGRGGSQPEPSVIGVYVRNSTLAQVGNARSEWQMDLVPYLEGMGFGVRVYEEWGVSGSTLAARQTATSMLADLQAGRIHGIAVAELSRLARDERGIDTAFIGDQLKRHAEGRLITFGRVFDLRRPDDWNQYQTLTMIAGWQRSDIRNTMYAGVVKAAERGPMFKGKVKVGYKRLVLVDASGQVVTVGGGRVRTTLEKDYGRAETMQALAQEFDRQHTLSGVVSALRVRHIDRQGGGKFQRDYWMSRDLRLILADPLYIGEWRLINGSVRSDVWAQFAREGFDPVEICHEVPHLAWFTKAQVSRWREKFLNSERPAARRRKYTHPLLGVLSCAVCGTPLQRGGTLNAGPNTGDLLYRCMGRRARIDHEWAISQRIALSAMRELLPEVLARTDDVVSSIWAKLASGPAGSVEQRLAAIEERECFIRDKWLLSMQAPPQWLLDEIQQLDVQKRRLQEEADALSSQHLLRQRAAEVLRMCGGDPAEAFDRLTPDQQAAVWQVLVTDVRFGSNGGRGAHRKVWVATWKPVGESCGPQTP